MLALSFLAGVLTSASPCVLPLVPILLASAVQKHPLGPLALVLGLALSFSALGVTLASIGFALAIDADVIRTAAVIVLGGFGVVLLSTALQQRFARAGGGLLARADGLIEGAARAGLAGQFGLGVLLGIVWAPCAGPTLGAAVGLAADSGSAPRAAAMMFLFGLGTAAPILALAYGSRRWLSAGRRGLRGFASVGKPVMGAALVAIAVLLLSGADKAVETALTQAMPDWLLEVITRV